MEKPNLSLQGSGRIYLDHNATTPPHPEVLKNIGDWANSWGNPSSIHWSGRGPKNLIREARQSVARMINAHPLEIVFTSGGSEGNNLVLKGVWNHPDRGERNEIVSSAVEHPSVLKTLEYLKAQGAVVHLIPVGRDGRLDMDALQAKLSERTALVSVMYANNETGSIMPVPEIVKAARSVGAKIHTDAVQALGKVVVDVRDWDVDFATFSAHKFYGLKGSGAVYCRKGQSLTSLIHGGGQERGRRAGTENTLAIAAFGHMAAKAADVPEQYRRIKELRDHMENRILETVTGVFVTGAGVKRLPNTSSLVIDGVDGESLLMNLDIEGVSVSTGAACSSGSPEPSPVLIAMGLTRAEAQASLRLTLGWGNTQGEMERFLEILNKVVIRLRELRRVKTVVP